MDGWRYEFEHCSPEEVEAAQLQREENAPVPTIHLLPPQMNMPAAMRKAEKVINEWQGEWPEDDWIGIDEGWDLNLFEGPDGRGATLYPVYDGNTCTRASYPVM